MSAKTGARGFKGSKLSVNRIEGGDHVTFRSLEIHACRKHTRNRPVYQYFAIPAILLLTGALLLRAVPFFIDLT